MILDKCLTLNCHPTKKLQLLICSFACVVDFVKKVSLLTVKMNLVPSLVRNVL